MAKRGRPRIHPKRRRGKQPSFEFEGIGPELTKLLPTLDQEMRQKAIHEGLAKAAKIVTRAARSLAPRGDPNHKPQLPAMRDTIKWAGRRYAFGRVGMAFVGAEYIKSYEEFGYLAYDHSNPIEFGHVIRSRATGEAPLTGKARTRAKKFLAPAADRTRQHQARAIIGTLQKYIAQAEKKSAF